MTRLVDFEIEYLCRQKNMIKPFVSRSVAFGMSYGLSHVGYDVRIAQNLHIKPGGCELASTMECFSMPNNVSAVVHDKSTWARRFLTVQNTFIEPGWRGFLTLELVNHSEHWLEILAGSPIAQIVFERHAYPRRVYDGKYQDQPEGPQLSLFEESTSPG